MINFMARVESDAIATAIITYPNLIWHKHMQHLDIMKIRKNNFSNRDNLKIEM